MLLWMKRSFQTAWNWGWIYKFLQLTMLSKRVSRIQSRQLSRMIGWGSGISIVYHFYTVMFMTGESQWVCCLLTKSLEFFWIFSFPNPNLANFSRFFFEFFFQILDITIFIKKTWWGCGNNWHLGVRDVVNTGTSPNRGHEWSWS